jgi:hypothetical protein
MTEDIKRITNFEQQNAYATYKSKAEIDKALRLLKNLHLRPSTHKFLSYFSHKGAKGVTQAKIETICEKVGISLGVYHKSVKPDLDSFPEPLIVMIPSQKIGTFTSKKGSRVVKKTRLNKGSNYKILQPLWKIEKWIPQMQEDFLKQQTELIENIIGEQERNQIV